MARSECGCRPLHPNVPSSFGCRWSRFVPGRLRGRGHNRFLIGLDRQVVFILTFSQQDGNWLVDGNACVPFSDKQFADDAVLNGFELHYCLVRLDFGQQIPGGNRVAFLHVPFGQIAIRHRR